MPSFLEACLWTVAALQLGLAFLNLVLPTLLKWRKPLDGLPLLLKEVFYVHLFFISITCAVFGVFLP